MEWWWDQPNQPEVVKWVSEFRKGNAGTTPSARSWFGWVAIWATKIAAEKAKSLEAIKMVKALENEELPPHVALQPGKVFFRGGDHELMANIFVGQVHPEQGQGNYFKVAAMVPGEQAQPLSETGCHMTYPA